MAGLCTLLALILIAACIYTVFCSTGKKVEENSQETPKECSRIHVSVEKDPLVAEFENIPPAPTMYIKV